MLDPLVVTTEILANLTKLATNRGYKIWDVYVSARQAASNNC